ncbi:MAG: hypothetical protein RJQ10_11495 [Haliea sp.]|uniref:hypothetical protein n=1 Tax=Haliea sp. TaxID=1932666 RepID=UPI0032EBCC67
MEFIAALVMILVIGGIVFVSGHATKRKEAEAAAKARAEQVVEVGRLAEQVQNSLAKMETAKTLASRVNHTSRALEHLELAFFYPVCTDVISNAHEIRDRLKAMIRVFPVIDLVEKSYRQRFKGKSAAELSALQDALYEIGMKGITNVEIEQAQIYPEGTGEIVTIESIQDRCRKLGWEPR